MDSFGSEGVLVNDRGLPQLMFGPSLRFWFSANVVFSTVLFAFIWYLRLSTPWPPPAGDGGAFIVFLLIVEMVLGLILLGSTLLGWRKLALAERTSGLIL